MNADETRVFVVDDDDSVRTGVQRLLRSAGWEVEAFASARQFLERPAYDGIGCLLLDVRMPSMTGPTLHDCLSRSGFNLPVIFLTAHADVPTGVQAMKKGAVDFLLKPVDEEVLLQAIGRAMCWHADESVRREQVQDTHSRLQRLSPRERQVMDHVVRGRMNKQIASDLGISEKTVKVHRAHVMEKMGIRSVAELVHLCDAAAVSSVQPAGHTSTRPELAY